LQLIVAVNQKEISRFLMLEQKTTGAGDSTFSLELPDQSRLSFFMAILVL
jgi:hypothetical protein